MACCRRRHILVYFFLPPDVNPPYLCGFCLYTFTCCLISGGREGTVTIARTSYELFETHDRERPILLFEQGRRQKQISPLAVNRPGGTRPFASSSVLPIISPSGNNRGPIFLRQSTIFLYNHTQAVFNTATCSIRYHHTIPITPPPIFLAWHFCLQLLATVRISSPFSLFLSFFSFLFLFLLLVLFFFLLTRSRSQTIIIVLYLICTVYYQLFHSYRQPHRTGFDSICCSCTSSDRSPS